MSDKSCPVNSTISSLRAIITSEAMTHPKNLRIIDEILILIQEIAEGRAGSDHLSSIEAMAHELICEGLDEISRKTGESLVMALREHHEVFLSHIETRNCAAGDCLRLTPAPCQITCPAGLDIPTYVTLIGMGRYDEAIDVIRKDNPFPWVCGLVCTKPCELMCVRGRIDEPVSIRHLKAFAAKQAMSERKYNNPEKKPDKGKKVCIIGAGPAGMSAAYYLALNGYGVRILESMPFAGGMMMLGIPCYRIPKDVVDLESEMLEYLGVDFRFNTAFGKDVSLEELKKEGFEAFFFAIGAQKSFKLNLPGEENFPQVIQAIDLLRQITMGKRNIPGKKIIIIGGGNVAIDAARTCIRLGCEEVTMAYRRTRLEMPADHEEIEQAIEEGINMSFLTIPAEIMGENGIVTALHCIRAEMVSQEGSTRKYPVPIRDSDFFIEADTIISAIGQQVDHDCLSVIPDLKWTKRNTIETNMITMETNLPGIFAAGDAVTGPATVIEAIAGGKRAAESIERFLSGIPQPSMMPVPTRHRMMDCTEVPVLTKMSLKRPQMPLLNIERRRKTFHQVELGYPEHDIRKEAMRCLRCDVCIRCGLCEKTCRDKMGIEALKMGYIQFDNPLPTDFTITEERCILCGACAENCPTNAMRIEDRDGERILSLCGSILNRQKLACCEGCGSFLGTEKYLDYVSRKTSSIIKIKETCLCEICSRRKIAESMAL